MCKHTYKHSEPCGCEVEVTVRSRGPRYDWIIYALIGLIIAAIIGSGDPVSNPATVVQYTPKAEPVEWGRWIAMIVALFLGIAMVFIGMLLLADYLFARGGWRKIFRKRESRPEAPAIKQTQEASPPVPAKVPAKQDRRLRELIRAGKVCYDYVDLNSLSKKK